MKKGHAGGFLCARIFVYEGGGGHRARMPIPMIRLRWKQKLKKVLELVFISSLVTLLFHIISRQGNCSLKVSQDVQNLDNHLIYELKLPSSGLLRRLLYAEFSDWTLRLLNLTTPVSNLDNIQCIFTSTVPSTPICIYNVSQDKFITAQLLSEGVWEPEIIKLFQKALKNYSNASVIDIGANIGMYALLAAKMDRQVIAVEPVYNNIIRLHKAIKLAGTDHKIKLVFNAISHRHEYVTFKFNKHNQGGTSVRPISKKEAFKLREKNIHLATETVTIDDLLQISNFPQAIIKIDIEGFDCHAILGAEEFLNKISVPYIFMEWSEMFKRQHLGDSLCPNQSIRKVTEILTKLDYIPHMIKTGAQLDPLKSTTSWQNRDVYWRHQMAPLLHPP